MPSCRFLLDFLKPSNDVVQKLNTREIQLVKSKNFNLNDLWLQEAFHALVSEHCKEHFNEAGFDWDYTRIVQSQDPVYGKTVCSSRVYNAHVNKRNQLGGKPRIPSAEKKRKVSYLCL